MARKSQRLSASELDPEDGTDYADARKRRFELTPLFWGLVSVTGLGLLVAVVVLLGLLVGVGASSNADFGTKFDQLTDSLKATGACKQHQVGPWRGSFLMGAWVPLPGEGPVTPTQLFVASTSSTSYESVVNNRRRLSEMFTFTGSNLCSFDTEANCNAENDNPYKVLLTSMWNYYSQSTGCEEQTPFSEAMPEFSTKDACLYMNDQLATQPCFDASVNCIWWIEHVDALKALYSHPCYWSPTDTLGNKLSRYFSNYNGYVSISQS